MFSLPWSSTYTSYSYMQHYYYKPGGSKVEFMLTDLCFYQHAFLCCLWLVREEKLQKTLPSVSLGMGGACLTAFRQLCNIIFCEQLYVSCKSGSLCWNFVVVSSVLMNTSKSTRALWLGISKSYRQRRTFIHCSFVIVVIVLSSWHQACTYRYYWISDTGPLPISAVVIPLSPDR